MLPPTARATRRRACLRNALALTRSASCTGDDATFAAIDRLFVPFSGDSVPGASVLVVRDGQVVHAKAYGMANLEDAAPARTDTYYRLASITKQFTATAVLLLARDGRLTLDTPLTAVLPDFPAYGSTITLRHLLTHTSGVPDYEAFVPDSQSWQLQDRDVLAILARTEGTSFLPGSAYRYSNSGYALLALVVERVSGKRFARFLHDRIFDPLGMAGTVAFERGISTVPNRAFGYTVAASGITRTDQSPTSAVLGDGGVYSSVEDLAKWDGALTRGSILDSALWVEATTPARLTDGSATEYGFGWITDRYRGRLRHWHNGETRGFTNAIMRFPDDRLTIVILTNRTGSAPWGIAERIADLFLLEYGSLIGSWGVQPQTYAVPGE